MDVRERRRGVILPTDVEREPWMNGGGSTRVLVRRPDLRISVAEIVGRAEFSELAGIDRVLTPLSGPGLALVVDGRARTVSRHGTIAFRGEQSVVADAAGDRVEAVNLMVRREYARLDASLCRGIPRGAADALVILTGTATVFGMILPPGTVLLRVAHPHLEVGPDAVVLRARLGPPAASSPPAQRNRFATLR